MYEAIIPLLRCPTCNKPLTLKDSILENEDIIEGKLICRCDEIWEIKEGVLDFRVEEQESVNRWSELTKDMTFEELDEMILRKTPSNQQELILQTIEDIISYLNDSKPNFVVDIATGRGMLLNRLAKNAKNEFNLVCTDLSFVVLKADREKIKKHNPKIKVSFIACDATNLPFLDNSYDLVLSLMGISNMGDLIPNALLETHRILKRGHFLLNGTIIIEENSIGYKTLREFFKSQESEGFEKFLLVEELSAFHKNSGFEEAVFKKVGESFGQKNELDLLPYEGEWFGIGNVYAKK